MEPRFGTLLSINHHTNTITIFGYLKIRFKLNKKNQLLPL